MSALTYWTLQINKTEVQVIFIMTKKKKPILISNKKMDAIPFSLKVCGEGENRKAYFRNDFVLNI